MKVIRMDKKNPPNAELLKRLVPQDILEKDSVKVFGAADNFVVTKRPEIVRLTPKGRRASKFYAS